MAISTPIQIDKIQNSVVAEMDRDHLMSTIIATGSQFVRSRSYVVDTCLFGVHKGPYSPCDSHTFRIRWGEQGLDSISLVATRDSAQQMAWHRYLLQDMEVAGSMSQKGIIGVERSVIADIELEL